MAFLKYSDVGIVEAEEGVIEFEVTKEHLKLLRHMYITWDESEFGAPAVDPKRPYGNSQVYDDMRAILGELGELYYPEEVLDLLHKQTAIALQIVLKTGKYKATKYRAPKYTQDWKEYNPKVKKVKEDDS